MDIETVNITGEQLLGVFASAMKPVGWTSVSRWHIVGRDGWIVADSRNNLLSQYSREKAESLALQWDALRPAAAPHRAVRLAVLREDFDEGAPVPTYSPSPASDAARLRLVERALRMAAGVISTLPNWSEKHPQETYEWLVAMAQEEATSDATMQGEVERTSEGES